MKTEQIRATIDIKVKEVLEAEAEKLGLDLSLYVRIILGERARELMEREKNGS